jgi:cyclic dehypoxanthinyl futalosine synthase
MIEENVVAEAGTVHFLTLDQIRAAIEELGFEARQRDVFYQLVEPSLEQLAIESNRRKTVAEEKRLPVLDTVAP